MEVSKELLEKAKAAKSESELKALAKAEGISLTDAEAEKFFARLHHTGELADEELDSVTGGCGGSGKPTDAGGQDNPALVTFRYVVGQEVEVFNNYSFSTCTTRYRILECKVEEYWSDEYNRHRYAPRYHCAEVDHPSKKQWVYQSDIEDPDA